MNTLLRSSSQLVNPLARQRMMGFGTAAGGGVSYIPPLDAVSSKVMLAGALFRLFTGNAESTRIRESGGSTEADIGSLAAGGYDAASFTAHVGGGTGYVAKLYDQNGTKDLVQATAGTQPSVNLTSGINSIPAMVFSGAQQVRTAAFSWSSIGTGDFEVWFLCRPTVLGGGDIAIGSRGGFSPEFYVRVGGQNKPAMWIGSVARFNTTLATNTTYLLRFYRVSGVLYCDVNGTQEATSHAYTLNFTPLGASTFTLGNDGGTLDYFQGQALFTAVFGSGLTSGEAAALTTALKTIGGIA